MKNLIRKILKEDFDSEFRNSKDFDQAMNSTIFDVEYKIWVGELNREEKKHLLDKLGDLGYDVGRMYGHNDRVIIDGLWLNDNGKGSVSMAYEGRDYFDGESGVEMDVNDIITNDINESKGFLDSSEEDWEWANKVPVGFPDVWTEELLLDYLDEYGVLKFTYGGNDIIYRIKLNPNPRVIGYEEIRLEWEFEGQTDMEYDTISNTLEQLNDTNWVPTHRD